MATNGNGSKVWGVTMFLAGLVAALAGAYVLNADAAVNAKVDKLEDRVNNRLAAIEEKIDRLLLRSNRNP